MKAAKAADGAFPTKNDSGGVAWQAATNWHSPQRGVGGAVYPGTKISVLCYALGTGNVPGRPDKMWLEASWTSGAGWGSGWINQHFVNDGRPDGQAPAGVPACGASHVFATANDAGGVYWRSGTSWGTPVSSSGSGMYPGTKIDVVCYQRAQASVPGSADTVWLRAYWSSGRGWGVGWVNQHFVKDGLAAGQAPPRVPACPPPNGPSAPH